MWWHKKRSLNAGSDLFVEPVENIHANDSAQFMGGFVSGAAGIKARS